MSDNMNKGFDQVAAFQKLWTASFANMASILVSVFARLPALRRDAQDAGRNAEGYCQKLCFGDGRILVEMID